MRSLALAATFVLVAVSAIVHQVAAQEPAAWPFANIRRLDCAFTVSAAGTWNAGEPHAEITRGATFRFQIEELDESASSARVTLGATGATVTARAAGANLHIIDRRSENSMALTTVLGEPGKTRFKAVHTRSEYHAYNGPGFTAVPVVEQLYGFCTSAGR